MSHFCVLVVGDVESQLAPFDENDRSTLTLVEEPTQHFLDEYEKLPRDEKAEYGTFEGFLRERHGYTLKDGQVFTSYNPKSKWDWYQEGGRYPGRLAKSDGAPCNSALVSELDFEKMRAAGVVRAEAWWRAAQEEIAKYGSAFGHDPKITHEEYVARHSRFSCFAVLKDGKWYEKGSMGWWGMVSGEKDDAEWLAQVDKLLTELKPEDRVTIIDCHI